MPIGPQKRTSYPPTSPSDPRTGIFHFNLSTRPPPYKPTPEPSEHNYLPISSTRDLHYFHAVASGEYPGSEPLAPGVCLVLHLFRGTETHRFPIAERLNIGPAVGTPYYAAYATPSLLDTFEYNTLIVSRRNPAKQTSDDVCTVEIRPNLDLFRAEITELANIKRGIWRSRNKYEEQYTLSWADKATGPLGACWSLWKDGKGIAHFYAEQGFLSLDQDPGRGKIRVKSGIVVKSPTVGYSDLQDPHPVVEDLAFLEFGTQNPTFVSAHPHAHVIMDVLIAGLFAILTLATRKAAIVRRWEEEQWQRGGPPPSSS